MKLIIAGSRSVNEHDHMLVEKALQESGLGIIVGSCLNIDEVVCGMARGADTLGYNWALNQGLSVTKFPADWDMFGKKAGFIRNQTMVDYADAALFLWDGHSRGTADCIRRAKRKGIPIYVHLIA
jgi:hypothetical protein